MKIPKLPLKLPFKATKKTMLLSGAAVLATAVLLTGFLWPQPPVAPSSSGSSLSQPDSSVSEESAPQWVETSTEDLDELEESSSEVSSSTAPSSAGSSSSASASASSKAAASSSSAPAPKENASSKPESKPESGSDSESGSGSSGGGSSSTPSNPAPAPTPSARGKYLVGYYPNYARSGGFTPLDLEADLLTHINYAFASINSSHQIVMANSSVDLKNFADLRQLKKQNPELKTLISVGGWDYSKNFSNAAATATSREAFAQSCVEFIIKHGFDGVDLDWEFPVSGGLPGNSNRPEDKQNFTKLLRAVRNKLDAQAEKDGRPYYLTIAGAPNVPFLNKIEPSAVASLVDYIFIMGYDVHGPWDSYADLNAPLYTPGEWSPQYKNSLADGVDAYLNRGVPASKLVLGMPFYGYQYTVNDGSNNGLYSRYSSSRSISYDKIAQSCLNGSYDYFYHDDGRVPYLFNGSTFISYDDEDSIAEKAQFARSYGLAGVGAWELSQDKNAVLLSSAYSALRG